MQLFQGIKQTIFTYFKQAVPGTLHKILQERIRKAKVPGSSPASGYVQR